jgi:hypothetical protein
MYIHIYTLKPTNFFSNFNLSSINTDLYEGNRDMIFTLITYIYINIEIYTSKYVYLYIYKEHFQAYKLLL